LLPALKDFKLDCGLEFLLCVFRSANAASQALQAQDVDLAEAVNAVEKLLEQVSIMITDDKFQCVHNDVV